MARPTSKTDLQRAATERYRRLRETIDAMTESERTADFDFGGRPPGPETHWTRDRNLRDVLIHLHEWHRLLLDWVAANRAGEAAPFLPRPYTWKTYGDLNVALWRRHQETSLDEALRLVGHSHEQVMALIDGFTDAELFEKRHFAWTGTTSLGSSCISATSSHYEWALTKIRAHLRASGAADRGTAVSGASAD